MTEDPYVVFHEEGVRVVASFHHDVECPIGNGWGFKGDEGNEYCKRECYWLSRVEMATSEDFMGQMIYLPPKSKQEMQRALFTLASHLMAVQQGTKGRVECDSAQMHCGKCGQPQEVRGARFTDDQGNRYFYAWCDDCNRITAISNWCRSETLEQDTANIDDVKRAARAHPLGGER